MYYIKKSPTYYLKAIGYYLGRLAFFGFINIKRCPGIACKIKRLER